MAAKTLALILSLCAWLSLTEAVSKQLELFEGNSIEKEDGLTSDTQNNCFDLNILGVRVLVCPVTASQCGKVHVTAPHTNVNVGFCETSSGKLFKFLMLSYKIMHALFIV